MQIVACKGILYKNACVLCSRRRVGYLQRCQYCMINQLIRVLQFFKVAIEKINTDLFFIAANLFISSILPFYLLYKRVNSNIHNLLQGLLLNYEQALEVENKNEVLFIFDFDL